ncbi:hypothetical protein [Pseudomonas viridiflava]|uniref:hypothetical protein n=1 Tax=Pseudomonas viridiflava TaxID=33069 RepID=UPI000F02F8EA|nr:hypothetical protein [Pseudomonas viridiflava]
MAMPKTIADSLLEELNSYSTAEDRPDPFTTARLKRKSAELAKVDPIGGLLCEAILLTLEGDYRKVVSNFREILVYRPEDSDMYENFGNSLGRLDHLSEAHDQYIKALEFCSDSTSILVALAKNSLVTFRTEDFIQAYEVHGEKADQTALANSDVCKEVIGLHLTFEKFKVDSRQAAKLYDLAEEVCQSFRKPPPSGNLRHTAPYSGATLTFYGDIKGSFSEVADMNFALCDLAIEREAGHILREFSYVFVCTDNTPATEMDFEYAHHQ